MRGGIVVGSKPRTLSLENGRLELDITGRSVGSLPVSNILGIACACDRVGRRLQAEYGAEPIPGHVLIEAVVAECGCEPESVLPTDRCYNRTNKGIPLENSPVFIYEGGLFRYVGPNFPYTGPVYHKPKGERERVVAWRIEGKLRCDDNDVGIVLHDPSSAPPRTGGPSCQQAPPTPTRASSSRRQASVLRIDPETAIRAVRDYNDGSYRGRRNLELDKFAYDSFREGLPDAEEPLTDLVCFVGEVYGGADGRFLVPSYSYRKEAILIVKELRLVLDQWRSTVKGVRAFAEEIPNDAVLEFLFKPFVGTQRWGVWASKTLHFLRPDAFPILDSHAKNALGLRMLASSPYGYKRFCLAFRDALAANDQALAAARDIDGGASPTDLKLFDKILYQLGK